MAGARVVKLKLGEVPGAPKVLNSIAWVEGPDIETQGECGL